MYIGYTQVAFCGLVSNIRPKRLDKLRACLYTDTKQMKGGERVLNRRKLKARFVEYGYSQKEVAEAIGITPRTLTRRLQEGVFWSDEISALMELLDIEDPVPYFLTKNR